MASKKLQIEVIQDTNEIVNVSNSISDFELNAEIVAGSLTSNAKELRTKIESELKNYTVEKYIDNPDAAKTDKAILNKVKQTVADKRKEITKKWNEPLDTFLEEMKTLENSITSASCRLSCIVNEADVKEKELKKQQISEFYSTLDFKLVTIDKIFNPKWLNKTTKMAAIQTEIESIIEKITTEMATIKSMDDADKEVLMAFYLDKLDLNATIQYGNQLKANRTIIQQNTVNMMEKVGLVDPIPETKAKPIIVEDKNETVAYSPNESHNGVVQENVMTFTLKLTGTKQKLSELRKFIDANGIKYEKL